MVLASDRQPAKSKMDNSMTDGFMGSKLSKIFGRFELLKNLGNGMGGIGGDHLSLVEVDPTEHHVDPHGETAVFFVDLVAQPEAFAALGNPRQGQIDANLFSQGHFLQIVDLFRKDDGPNPQFHPFFHRKTALGHKGYAYVRGVVTIRRMAHMPVGIHIRPADWEGEGVGCFHQA